MTWLKIPSNCFVILVIFSENGKILFASHSTQRNRRELRGNKCVKRKHFVIVKNDSPPRPFVYRIDCFGWQTRMMSPNIYFEHSKCRFVENDGNLFEIMEFCWINEPK